MDFKLKLLLIPGGPGIDAAYFEILKDEFRGQAQGIDCCVIDYKNLALKKKSSFKSVALGLKKNFDKNTEEGTKTVIVAHSFGARLVTWLVNEGKISPDLIFLLNWIPDKPPLSFQKQLKKLSIETTGFKEEKDFCANWVKMIPVYFGKDKVSNSNIKILSNHTYWLKSFHLASDSVDLRKCWKKTNNCRKAVFIASQKDPLMSKKSFDWAKKTFSIGNFWLLENCGHFPMLEKKSWLVKNILLRIKTAFIIPTN